MTVRRSRFRRPRIAALLSGTPLHDPYVRLRNLLADRNTYLSKYLYLKDSLRVAGNPSLKALHKELRFQLAHQNREWPHFRYARGYFYQSLDEVCISGVRPTEKRFSGYGLAELLSADQEVLDIGANAGFMSILISKHVRHVDAIEWNPYQIAIGRKVAAYLKISNISFVETKFQNFSPEKQYDIITSFAIHTIGESGMKEVGLRQYFEHLHGMLKEAGTLCFESHSGEVHVPIFYKTIDALSDIFDQVSSLHFKHGELGRGERCFFALRKK